MKHTRQWMIGTLMAVTLGSSLALAWGPGCDGPGGREGMKQKMTERMEQRQKALHDALKLTPDQEPAWNTYAAKFKAPMAGAEWPDRAAMEKLTMPERMEKMNELARQHLKAAEERTAATKAFYNGLSAEQKKVFDESHRGMMGKPHRGGPDGGRPDGGKPAQK